MAALTLPTPQYNTGIPAASNTPADSSRKATTTSVFGNSRMKDPLVVDGRAQAQCLPRIVDDDIQIDQGHQRVKLISRALTKIGSRRHRAPGRKHIIDQYQASLATLHIQDAGTILEFVGHIDHRRRQFALFANQHKPLAAAVREGGAQDEAARLDSRQGVDLSPLRVRE